MIPRSILTTLVFAIPLLLVSLAVLAAAYLVALATHDVTASTALLWAATICLMLTVIDLVLLVGALGLQALQQADEGLAHGFSGSTSHRTVGERQQGQTPAEMSAKMSTDAARDELIGESSPGPFDQELEDHGDDSGMAAA